MTFALRGICASKGIAVGKIYVIDRDQLEVVEYTLHRRQVDAEVERYRNALAAASEQLNEVKNRVPGAATGEVSAFIDTHLMMLADSALSTVPVDIIRKRRCNAEWALKLQRDNLVSVFDAMQDPYLRSRKDDVDQVVNRVQRVLLDQDKPLHERTDGRFRGCIVFADDLTPADTVLMQHEGIAAFLTEFGGPNSHTAILARSLGVPAIVGLHQARPYLRDEELVIIDGRQGVVLVDPDDRLLAHYRKRSRDIERHRIARKRLKAAPTVTADGESVVLQANVELPADVQAARQVGAAGIGLYRTEYLFMNRLEPPDEEEQYQAYMDVVKGLKGAPVTIRTLDLGADKQVDGGRASGPVATNPALGLRAVRLCLKDPGLFRPQLRAILRASATGRVRMMIPMLSNLQEMIQVVQILKECRRELERQGIAFDPDMAIGAMVEVPAAAICADLFARHLDFLSIGTNDLIQYTMAIDRIDDEVNYLYDPLHPAVLRLIQATIRAGHGAGIPVAMCGEMAGDARYTRLLLGLGLREFSVHPNSLLEIKQVVNLSHISPLKRMTHRIMRAVKGSTRATLLDRINHGEMPRA